MRDEEHENARKKMVAKTIEKEHSNMINWWKELDKIHRSVTFTSY